MSAGAHWDFIPNLHDNEVKMTWDPTNTPKWLRNPNSSTASTVSLAGMDDIKSKSENVLTIMNAASQIKGGAKIPSDYKGSKHWTKKR